MSGVRSGLEEIKFQVIKAVKFIKSSALKFITLCSEMEAVSIILHFTQKSDHYQRLRFKE